MRVKSLPRTLINRFLVRTLPTPFRHEGGDCWSAALPALARYADDEAHPRRSTLTLYEDGIPLQQPHCSADEIRGLGIGRYVHWQDRLLFSATDNSDPNANGKRYEFSISPWLYRRRVERPEIDPSRPVNHRKRDCSWEKIRSDVEYTMQVGGNLLKAARRLGVPLTGKAVLEIGPGINMGCPMLFAAYGAKPIVADRFLAPWDRGYHARFYDRLRQELRRADSAADVRPLEALLDSRGYPEQVIRRVDASLESLPLPDDSCDFVLSNAVVEHLYDLDASFVQLYRVTKPGGFNLHQVDFRDHRNFDKPLEYLLLDDETFRLTFESSHSGCGNRWRAEETTQRFLDAGFEIVDFLANGICRPEYLGDFLPRLRASGSRYQKWPEEQLWTIGGLYTLRKPGASS